MKRNKTREERRKARSTRRDVVLICVVLVVMVGAGFLTERLVPFGGDLGGQAYEQISQS